MIDLAAEYALLETELEPAMRGVLKAGQYVHGQNVQALEAEIAAYCGTRHAVAVGSGTDALFIALRACGIGPGDEVITTPFSFVASASSILMCGAEPVFVDIDALTYNIDPSCIAAAITHRTRAILAVHLFGQPADLEPIRTLCHTHALRLIEDAAHAFGAEYAGTKAGAYGDAGCFSFYPTKNLGAFGDGGMIVTSDDDLATRARLLANHGRQGDEYRALGYNSRLDELQAVILKVKLPHVDAQNARRRENARAYTVRFEGQGVSSPYEDARGLHVYNQYTVRSERRDALRSALHAAGVASAVYYPVPLHRQELYARNHAGTSMPVAERLAREVISLPISPTLTEAQIDHVVAAALSAHRSGQRAQ